LETRVGRPLTQGPRPTCPQGHLGHVVSFGSRIRPDGLFAKSRYRCVPSSGVSAVHVFTLPKRAPWHLNPDGTMCANCSHEPGRTDGAPTALRSLYSVPEVARLLVETGTGTSLRLASRNLRIENNRLSHDDAGRSYYSRQNALAADYVDRYGPTIVAATRPSRWPRFLILDSVPLNMRMRDAEAVGLPFDTEGGAVLAAAGTDDSQRPAKAWHACLAGNETGESWFDLLDSIPTDTAPEWVVADDATAIRNAVMEKWPDAVFYPCIYHLRERGKLAATADGLNYDRAVGPALETCFRSTDDWDRLRTLAQPPRGRVVVGMDRGDRRDRSHARGAAPALPSGRSREQRGGRVRRGRDPRSDRRPQAQLPERPSAVDPGRADARGRGRCRIGPCLHPRTPGSPAEG
jgi:hypothetical protein